MLGSATEIGTVVATILKLKATTVEPDRVASPVNCWSSVRCDIVAVTSPADRFSHAGYCYKTFKMPEWQLFDPSIRGTTGLCRAPVDAEPVRSGHPVANCDRLAIGGWESVIAATLSASLIGARVLLVEIERAVAEIGLGWGAAFRGEENAGWFGRVQISATRLSQQDRLSNAYARGGLSR